MALLVPVETAPTFAPKEATAAPDRLIEGAPAYKTWELDTALAEAANWGKIRTGVWEATEGKTISIKGETFEFCHILSGRCEIAEDGGKSHVFGPGDSFVMKPGFTGTWSTLETVRKIFVIAS
ncbi:cupin domain-containing protein [Salipiger mangrovisoli]|uniref:Cupin domain-containing protein n=1 Tax=Salipiger mangrovisoli TaxID=2865933 RepID=A0ABR9X9K1_9RHOB|nr:cupin domain-containing protein [Salipiger mangrovisoli]MBE9640285.1 cupin domain-containing protein [Salipiger mangrovisoli]